MNKNNERAIYKADFKCLSKLYNLHKDLPLAPEHFRYKLYKISNNEIK